MNELDLTRCVPGDRAEITVEVTEELINRFAEYSGDRNRSLASGGSFQTVQRQRSPHRTHRQPSQEYSRRRRA